MSVFYETKIGKCLSSGIRGNFKPNEKLKLEDCILIMTNFYQ